MGVKFSYAANGIDDRLTGLYRQLRSGATKRGIRPHRPKAQYFYPRRRGS